MPIGRFSQMTRLSIKALRIYDDMGLIRPALVDPTTGYRYYRPGQANRAEAIRILRGLEMPLDEIRLTLASGPDVSQKALETHRDRLEEKLSKHQRMLAFLTDLLTGKEQLMPYDIELKTVESQNVAAIRSEVSMETIGDEIGRAFPKLFHTVMGQGGQPAGAPFVIFHDVIDEENDGFVEVCMPTSSPIKSDGEVIAREISAGVVASTTHKGPYAEVGPAYHAISAWIAEHGHSTTGGPCEIYLNDPTEVEESEQLTEVQWPIDSDQ